MDTLAARSLTSQLADDLGWLEQHCRTSPERQRRDGPVAGAPGLCQQPEQDLAASRLRLATALVRNCIGPLLDEQPTVPLHIVVVGGAGAGKSTVANLLSGVPAAEANPQAGFTRHPIAYTSANGPLNWTGHNGFLGPLQRLNQASPSSLDQDVYQVRRIPSDPTSFDLLKDFVVWDCPDMTTWAATGYIPRLLEVAALADVIVYVASDERYNDEVPTQFLNLLLQAGKPVVVVLTKMKEADAETLVAHFQQTVVRQLPPGVVGILPIPYLTLAQLAQASQLAARYRIPLLNQVAVLGGNPASTRLRTAQGAINFLLRTHEQLLAVARQDLHALESWQALVRGGQEDFNQRYQREYLATEKFSGFDEALVRLMELLELPGVGRVISGTLAVLRWPFQALAGLVSKAMSRPEIATRPEVPVLEEAFAGWLDLLRKEAAHRHGSHPLWNYIAHGFHDGGLAELSHERFQQRLRDFQLSLASEVERTARDIYERLEKNPAMLYTLRGTKLTLDVGVIAGTVVTAGLHYLYLVLLVAPVSHQLVQLLGKGYVDGQRELTRHRQQLLLVQHLSAPLAEYLIQWPATGGSSFERLQLALRRIPANVQQVAHLLRSKRALSS